MTGVQTCALPISPAHAGDPVVGGRPVAAAAVLVVGGAAGVSARGGEGEIAALNKLIELAIPPIPFVFQEGGTQVIPGHGHVYEQGDLVEYRDMVVTVRDVVQDMMKLGMTLDQIKAGNPALPFEKQYGAKTGAWTTNDFVEAIYKGLSKK